MEIPHATESAAGQHGRPTALLPVRELLQLSVYWFGITTIWAALGVQALPNIVQKMTVAEFGLERGGELAPVFLAILVTLGAVVAIVVQPTFGSISDYTVTRWGRRKPYIAIGATLDVLFLLGIALADQYGIVLLFVMLLQFSSNLAQGPFQGYVPDLVPAKQVGLASSLMGLMIVLGQVGGATMVSASFWINENYGVGLNGGYGFGLVGVGLFELATALATILTVREGRAAKPREGRSWLAIARSTWGTDILRERSYVWLLASRLFILTASALLFASAQFYMRRSLGYTEGEALTWVMVATIVVTAMTALAVVPSGLLSNRYGRKRMIYLAALFGAIGMAVIAAAPGVEVAIAGALGLGLGAGTFLAVDWALMTDIIPKASSGRFMGISNVATGLGSTILPAILAGVITSGISIAVADPYAPLGPRAAIAASLLLFALGALALRPVDERRREDVPLEAVPAAALSPSAGE